MPDTLLRLNDRQVAKLKEAMVAMGTDEEHLGPLEQGVSALSDYCIRLMRLVQPHGPPEPESDFGRFKPAEKCASPSGHSDQRKHVLSFTGEQFSNIEEVMTLMLWEHMYTGSYQDGIDILCHMYINTVGPQYELRLFPHLVENPDDAPKD